MAKTMDLEKKDQNTAMARPDFIPVGGREGREHITKDDIQMPRLALAQSLSPQLDPSHALAIDGLKLGHMFNSLTGENYETGPIEFFILRADPPRWVEFIPREQGGGVKDPNVPANDPRTQFRMDAQGQPLPPLATKFYDFIILMLPWNENDPMDNVIALSFKSTGLKIARQLNMLIQKRNTHLYAGKYVVTSVDEQNAKGKFKNYQIKNAGWAETPQQMAALKEMADTFKDRVVAIDREGDDDATDPGTGDTSFTPDEM